MKFFKDPDSIENILNLDDSVLWGSLPMLMSSSDKILSELSGRLWERKLFKCIDIYSEISRILQERKGTQNLDHDRQADIIDRSVIAIVDELGIKIPSDFQNRILMDKTTRDPYKKFQESKGPLNQINIRKGEAIFDMALVSPVVANIKPFNSFRLYFREEDVAAKKYIVQTIKAKIMENLK